MVDGSAMHKALGRAKGSHGAKVGGKPQTL